ncbi:monoacylglycerol lipase ABHD6-like [Amphiura filiformis]|uniref:monoacylglycerol lipase ABHD6-like n=1 Tax=Amphiura filiformis TaxID=82378 RepID=UPI003B220C72
MEAWKLVCYALAIPITIGFLPMIPFLLPILIPLVLIGIFLYYVRPDILFTIFTEVMMWKHGCKQRYQTVKDYKFSYAERGRFNPDKATMLYLHGYSAGKDMFWPFMPRLPKDQHVILLDLPGHGRTARRMDDSFSFESQAQRVHQFVVAMGMNNQPLHIIGMSMGGGIGGLYAAKYPEDLTKLTLICPAGIKTETLSDYDLAVKERKLPAELPETAEIFKLSMPYFTYTVPKVPGNYFKGIALMRRKHNTFYRKVLNDIASVESRDSLRTYMGDITVPTQVIWGRNDRLLHPSGAEILREGIQDVEVHVLERCGHSVTMERPYKTSKLILNFADKSS